MDLVPSFQVGSLTIKSKTLAQKAVASAFLVHHKLLSTTSILLQDIKEGTGEAIRDGQTAVVDWDGYTIGYYGRPFEARNKVGLHRPCWRA